MFKVLGPHPSQHWLIQCLQTLILYFIKFIAIFLSQKYLFFVISLEKSILFLIMALHVVMHKDLQVSWSEEDIESPKAGVTGSC